MRSCLRIATCFCTCTRVIRLYVCMSVYVYLSVCLSVCLSAWMYVCMCVCVCQCVCVCACTRLEQPTGGRSHWVAIATCEAAVPHPSERKHTTTTNSEFSQVSSSGHLYVCMIMYVCMYVCRHVCMHLSGSV